MTTEPGSTRLAAGQLLVATPILVDPNFQHTVVLLLDHDQAGALGVVLNRPSSVPLASVLPDWADQAPDPDVIFQGGPVATDSAIAVARLGSPDGDPLGFRRVYADIGLLDLDTPPELLAPAVAGLRVFAGYAGWGSGQLEAEIAEGSWVVVPGTSQDIFGTTPERLWASVLRRQPGELAWLSTMPVDPGLN